MSPSRRTAALLATGAVLGLSACEAPLTRTSTAGVHTVTRTAPPSPTTSDGFDRTAHSIDAPDSLWIVVNKRRPLPESFTPTTTPVAVPHTNPPLLRAAAGLAVQRLFAAADHDSIRLASNSTYRSYRDQRRVYDTNLQKLGRAAADRLTAHPGCSEHQTGLAIDIGPADGRCSLATCMGELPEGRWLAAHAWRFGFLLRYPEDEVQVTGYQYEPWHFRYLGRPLAAELHLTRIATLEQYFALPAAPDYA